MPIGSFVRHVLGVRFSRRLGRQYRAIFVNLDKQAAALSAVIRRDAHVLDIGGGDGEPLNHLLAMRPDLRVTTIDTRLVVGQWIDACYDRQISRFPGTSIAQYIALNKPNPDVILIADVMHHIPPAARYDFLGSLSQILVRVPDLRIVVKDVEPGYPRALLGYWSDLFVTGDKQVNPISRDSLVSLMNNVLGPLHREDTNLFENDLPNYAIAFSR